MQEGTLEQLMFHQGDFGEKYKYFRRTRFFYPDSVADFLNNKNIKTFLSNLIFLSNPNSRLFVFRNASLKKISDEIYELNPLDRGSYAKAYSIQDETGEYPVFWPTNNSEIPHSTSCDQFEIAKNFRGDLLREVLLIGFKDRKDCYVYYVNFNNNSKKRKIWLPELIPSIIRT
ncbi:MAG: hypothetical protein AABX99_02320 [Nanoarchaeota archaeon]